MSFHNEQMISDILFCLTNVEQDKGVPIGVSNRHIHLSAQDLAVLFGSNYALSLLKPLSQTGQFAAKETVCIAGPKGCLTNVRILGPVRTESQVEISRTDAFTLGIKAPVRISGALKGAASICVIGPVGTLILKENVIIAKRHIHMSPSDAERLNLSDGQCVSVISNGEQQCSFHNVVVRVSPTAVLEMHIDTDEANAADLKNRMKVQIL